MAGFWESCLQRFEQELPAQQFNTWIKPLRLEGEASALDDGLRLIAPNGFILKWVRDRYLSRIEDYSRNFFAGPVTIALVIGSGKAAPARVETNIASTETAPAKPGTPDERKGSAQEKPGARKSNYEKSRLFPTFTFDNLVVPDPVKPQPTENLPDGLVRIVAAMVNSKESPEKEWVYLLNTADRSISLNGWQLVDKQKSWIPLSGMLDPGAFVKISIIPPVVLSNKGGIISLLNGDELKVDGVSYTREQANQPGWTIVFY